MSRLQQHRRLGWVDKPTSEKGAGTFFLFGGLHKNEPVPGGFFHPARRHAFTLLEVVLALGLTVIVMALVGTALTTTLRLVESGRVKTERDQLARAILAKIADDVRSSVRVEPFDASGMMKLSAFDRQFRFAGRAIRRQWNERDLRIQQQRRQLGDQWHERKWRIAIIGKRRQFRQRQ